MLKIISELMLNENNIILIKSKWMDLIVVRVGGKLPHITLTLQLHVLP